MFARFSNMFGGNENDGHSSGSPKSSSSMGSHSSSSSYSSQFSSSEQCQIDNSSSILEKIANLYAEHLMSDIILVVGKHEYPAHRLILCASSDVFQVMLMNPEWSESREQRIFLQEAPECMEVFELFLQYLYTGKINVSYRTVLPILALADKYNVKDLVAICSQYMQQNVVSATEHNCLISWLQYTLVSAHKDVARACMNHLKWNFERVAASEEFTSCDINLLITILSNSDLVVHDEMTLYHFVLKWLSIQEDQLFSSPLGQQKEAPSLISTDDTTQPSINLFRGKMYMRRTSTSSSFCDPKEQLEYITCEVMKFVRFPMMTPRQLAELLLMPLTIKYKEFFVTRMAIGMSFHSGHWERVRQVISDLDIANKLLFTPRLYTAEQWSSELKVDNFPALVPYHTRTLVFSTPASASELENESQLEWTVELYPKGVWFRKFYYIVWQGTVEVPEVILRTVRLSITSKDVVSARVQISVLVYSVHNNCEHVSSVVTSRHIFTPDENLLNLDDLIPFDELNDEVNGACYLLQPCNALKLHVIIIPLTELNVQTHS